MVTGTVPAVAALLAANVKTLLAKVAVTPLGRPVAAKLTALVKPPEGVIVIVSVPLAPCATVRLLGVAARVKSAGAAAGLSEYIFVKRSAFGNEPASPVK